jgi:hypothetical protein
MTRDANLNPQISQGLVQGNPEVPPVSKEEAAEKGGSRQEAEHAGPEAGLSSSLDFNFICSNSASLNASKFFSARSSSYGLSKAQRGSYGRMRSFISRIRGLGLGDSFKMLTFTTGPKGGQDKLRRHHNEFVRRVERVYRCRVIYFVVETSENKCPGVLHVMWAIESRRGLKKQFIPYGWLRQQWLDIHGAFEVRVRAIGGSSGDSHRVAAYYVAQYYAGQKAYVRSCRRYRKRP